MSEIDRARVEGSHLYLSGDDSAFRVNLPPDVLVSKIEAADDPGAFMAVPSTWTHVEDKSRVTRTMYFRPREVKAVVPHLYDPAFEDEHT